MGIPALQNRSVIQWEWKHSAPHRIVFLMDQWYASHDNGTDSFYPTSHFSDLNNGSLGQNYHYTVLIWYGRSLIQAGKAVKYFVVTVLGLGVSFLEVAIGRLVIATRTPSLLHWSNMIPAGTRDFGSRLKLELDCFCFRTTRAAFGHQGFYSCILLLLLSCPSFSSKFIFSF